MDTIELRNYLLKPGARDLFINYFKEHFVESQNILGAYIPGMFRIKDETDRFFWIRGFENMQTRSSFLPAFYGGEVWKEYGPAANDMMLEWHHVHLLKPLTARSLAFVNKEDVLVIDYYTTSDNNPNRLVDFLNKEYIPLLNQWGINSTTFWVSEMEENDFPRLPVYQSENLLIVITSYRSEQEYESTLNRLNAANKELVICMEELVKDKKSLILYPA